MAAVAGLWLSLVRLAPRLPGSDRDLLARFAATRDEPAFNELLRRHGGLVWSVCRRHLRDPADAEDAFQATFVVLAAKPHAVRRAESLGAWLHGTAWRVASRLRQTRRRTRPEVETAAPPDDPSLRDALAALDEELVRLPARLRDPLTACYLLERTQDEAAGDLGLSVSTVKRRLTTGRELLRDRLKRRGVELGAVLAALSLRSPDAPAALVQTTLSAATIGVASASVSPLVQGVLAMMWHAKLKAWAAGLGLAAATLGGTGYLATSGLGQGPPAPGPGTAKVEKPPTQGADKPEPVPKRGGPESEAVEELQFDIDRARLQIERAEVVINLEKVVKQQQQSGQVSYAEFSRATAAALQAKEDKLVAQRALKRAERDLALVKGQPQPAAKPKPEDAELRKLREQRVEMARATWKAHGRYLINGEGHKGQLDIVTGLTDLTTLLTMSTTIVEAELDVAATPAAQVAAWKDQQDRLRTVRESKLGRSGFGDAIVLGDAELVAKIRLLELGGK